MHLLTPDNLNQNYYRYSDYSAYQRGMSYYQSGMVKVVEFNLDSAILQVTGKQGTYTVTIKAISKERVSPTCQCPESTRIGYCRHIVAALLALRDYIQSEAQKNWQYRLSMALEKTPKKPRTRKEIEKSIALLGLEVNKQNNGEFSGFVYPFRVSAEDWESVDTLENLDPQDAAAYIDANRGWTVKTSAIAKMFDSGSVANLSPEAVHVFNLIISGNSSYYFAYSGIASFIQYLPLIEKLDIPLFLMKNRVFTERIHVQQESAPVEAAMTFDGKEYILQAGLRVGNNIYSTVKQNLKILAYTEPAWALAGTTIVPIENPESLQMMHFFPLSIPKEDEQRFRENYFQPISERMPIVGDIVTWVDVNEDPQPRLYLNKDESSSTLRAALKFGYGDHEVEGGLKAPPMTMFDIPGSWGAFRVHRKVDRETNYFSLLTDARFGLKRASGSGPAAFEIRSRVHPYDFLTRCIPALTKAGFEIFGEKDLGKINHSQPVIRLNIASGIDWFDLDATVAYGDQEVALLEVRKALKKGEAYIKLADGSIGEIPEAWLERYKHLFDLAEETESGLRVSNLHLSLVDELLADADEKTVAPEFEEKRGRLKEFRTIALQPIPAGFTGELRHYQKAGLDWLHFLHEYNFGGILADDMGLGKTIQMLAFIQSLREKGGETQASLLVVPKSLLANWQIEASRFTPNLRFLEFMGNQRKKDTSIFNDYDIILTTYGTMLRDIQFLRGYQFHYVILDESQAIKNPLAQSSKAARLLNAAHRLCMTGTPVENNTFELWSQFAFTNPGLLGSVDYFKTEFANPIENRQNDTTAQLLRRMVFPFILRRTKEQVAPELPSRTERLIYTDLEPAQRKLYNHTRDYYRGQLMGLMKESGMEDARMKILEGLLRLRQICIHPALVEPTYHGGGAKFEILLETLETLNNEGHKALVFSQFVQCLRLLEKEMRQHGLKYTYLDGKTTDRQDKVDTFQNDPAIPFFLISLKAGGVGLNLTAADYVIHLDPWWNPAVERQAADRVHRIGQDKPVFIYKFIARDTVEEKILKLQEHKKELVDQLISAEGSFFKSITPDDVKVLFS